ncbi:hydrolase [Maritimibacter sp. 55A14]|uniref:carbon-nitrogen hydrolase family protein n=1 Tax=Maritimibacter sp. 55A14 TaxID=2174844 RepID=UPI000D60D381|nr:carbon-nitrogen hydrolase family protein [Maritimibacter sp. 55A14]PWE33117.1 hydrolase [Maritimibacter sp. 55A14]
MKLGIWQCAAGGQSLETRLARLDAALAGRGADMVVCPELFLSGYNIGGAVADRADPCGGPGFQAVAAIAHRHGCAIAFGYPERGADGALYNAASVAGPDGTLLANHRKRLNAPGSFEGDWFADGAEQTLFDWGGLRLALLICYEVEFPETVRDAARAGAQIVLVPTALSDQWPVVARKLIPTRAFENGVWLAYANHAGTEDGLRYLGGSRIVAPDGGTAAEAGAQEALIMADLDPARVAAAQARLPYLSDLDRLARS